MTITPYNTDNNDGNFFDEEALDDMKTLMKERFPVLVENYLRSAEGYVAAAQSALHNKDLGSLINALHPLKASSQSLGLTALHDAAARIEESARKLSGQEQNIPPDFPALFGDLFAVFTKSEKLLKEAVKHHDTNKPA